MKIKIKGELEELDLPKSKLCHGLRHGLIQLMTKCSVVVERLPSRYVFRYYPNIEENFIGTDCLMKKELEGQEKTFQYLAIEKEASNVSRFISNFSSPSMEPTVSVINRVDNILLTNEKSSNSDKLSDKDIVINIPSVPSTNKNLLTYETSCNNRDSHKSIVSTPASNRISSTFKDDSPLFKERSLSERNSSTMNISEGIDLKKKNLVLENTSSTINVSSLTETQIFVELNANKNHSRSEKSSLNKEVCSKSNFPSTQSKMRSFSMVSDSSRNRFPIKIESRIQKSHTMEKRIFSQNTGMLCFEKKDCKKQHETKNKNFLKPCSTIVAEEHSLGDKLSSMSKSSPSTEDIQFKNPLCCDELSSRSILSENTSSTLEKIMPNKDDPLKSIDKSDLKLALPIKINLCAITPLKGISENLNNNSERISDIDSTNIVGIKNNTEIEETLISTEVDMQETVLGKEKRKLEESTINVKKQKRRSSAKKKCLKSIFRELFGDEDDESGEIENSSSVFNQKRRKVDPRDSCDSGTYFNETFPNSVTTFSKDIDLSEIFSPDSTGAEPKAASLKSPEKCKVTKEKAESPQCKISISISDDLTKTIVSCCPTNQKERPVLDKESPEVNEVIQGEENRALPDTTCVSEDELAVVKKANDSTEQVPKILSETEIEKETINDKTTLQCQASLNNLSDDLLSRAGIIKDVEQNSYVFSSDEINSLLNMLVGGIENNDNKTSENEPYLKPDKKSKETNPKSTDSSNKPNLQEDNQNRTESSDSDVEIVMEKGHSMPLISNSIPDTEKSTEKILPPIENTPPLSEKTLPSTPRLRVKDPSELGCPREFATLLNVSNLSDVSLPPQQILPSDTQTFDTFLMNNAYTENMSPSGTLLRTILSSEPFLSNLNDGQNTMPNSVSKVALSAAQKLISLICPLTVPNAGPQISQYYFKLMNMLAEISKDTVTLRQFYKNRALGLCSRDLLGFNLSLNKKLRSLSTFLQIAFEEMTLLSIFKNYHALTSGPILIPEELNYIMSLQYFDVQPNTNRVNQCEQRSPFPMNNIAFMHPPGSPIQLSLPSANIGQILMPGYLIRTFRPESFSTVQNYPHNASINNGKGYNVFTHEQLILLKSQIRDYNILYQRMSKLLYNQKIFVSEQSRTAVKKQSNAAQVTTASEANSVQQQRKQSNDEIMLNDMRSSENTTQDVLNSAQNKTIFFRNKSPASSVVIAEAAVSQSNINVSSTITNKKPSECDSSLSLPTEETVIIKSTPKKLVKTPIITRGTTSSVSNTSTSAFSKSNTVTTTSISLNSTQIPSVSKTSNLVPIQTNAATLNETECDITNQNTNLLIRNRLPIQQKIGNISTVRTRNIPIKKAKCSRSSVICTISTDDSIKTYTSAIKNRITSVNESNTNHVTESDKRKTADEYKSMPSLNSPLDPERKEENGPTDVSTPGMMEHNRKDSQSLEKFVRNISQSNDKEDLDEEYWCLQCNKKSIVACGRCEKAFYCSKTCQEKHWETIHHESCQPKKEEV